MTTPLSSSNVPETPAANRALLIGPQAAAALPLLRAWTISRAETVLDAVFISGREKPSLLLVGVSQELHHIERAVRSLRRVNPDARILLLCPPEDEAVCRKAREWGADDYLILPLDITCEKILNAPARAAVAQGRLAAPQAPATPAPAERTVDDMVGIPLDLHAQFLENVFEGAGTGDEFSSRALGALQRSLGLEGDLQFIAGETAAIDELDVPHQLQSSVAFTGQLPFGNLLWRRQGLTLREQVILDQMARWLAALLAVSRRYEQLRTMAITDELSGAYNRRYFMPKLTMLLKEARENQSRVTLLLFDIDDFKKYNDTFGHAAGDAIIRELIKLLHACTRPYDLVARIGGDEFAVVYRDNEAPRQPNSEHPKDVLAATVRFREAIRNHHWPQTCNIKGTVSISGGMASFPLDADSLEQLMAKADEALLKAKAGGKNVILLHNAKSPVPA